MEYKQILAIQKKNEQRWINIFPALKHMGDKSGIYILTREDELGIKYAYIGQAKHILQRLGEHLSGYQHIDISLKKHGLYDEYKNPTGWKIHELVRCTTQMLDEFEQIKIKEYADKGYQLRNKTGGGQGIGKVAIETKSTKTYREGIEQGKLNERKKIKEIFNKYLDAVIKGNTNKIKERKLKEFQEYIGENEDGR